MALSSISFGRSAHAPGPPPAFSMITAMSCNSNLRATSSGLRPLGKSSLTVYRVHEWEVSFSMNFIFWEKSEIF